MSFLVDTNVVSEWVRPRPNPGVVAWLADTDEDQVFLSVVTLAELRHGIERIAAGRRQKQLSAWLENDLPGRFEGRILSIDAAVADACGKLVARSEAAGRSVEAIRRLPRGHCSGSSVDTCNPQRLALSIDIESPPQPLDLNPVTRHIPIQGFVDTEVQRRPGGGKVAPGPVRPCAPGIAKF